MLNDPKLQKIAKQIVNDRAPDAELQRVVIEATTDEEGNDALRIVLVLTPESARAMTGDQALDVLVDIQKGLLREHESRFPIVEYATEAELEEDTSAVFDDDEADSED